MIGSPTTPELDRGAPARQYERMFALAELVLAGSSLEDVLEQVARAATALLPADRGASVLLWDPVTESFAAAATTIAGQDPGTVARRTRVEGGASRWVVDEHRQLAVADVAEDPFGPSGRVAAFGIGAYVATPILAGDHALGVLYALAGRPRRWAEEDLAFLRILAARAAAAIEARRLADEAGHQRDRAEVLSFVANALVGVAERTEVLGTIVDAVAAGVAADHVELRTDGLRVGDATRVVEGPMGPGTAEIRAALEVARRHAVGAVFGLALSPETLEAELGHPGGAAVVAPLRYGERTIGFLTALRGPGRPAFTGEDAALLSSIANQAVVAIENVSLLEETEEALAELSAHYEIVQVQNREVELEEMLRAVCGVVASAIPAARVAVGVRRAGREPDPVVSGGPDRAPWDGALVADLARILAAGLPEGPRAEPGSDERGPRLVVPLRHRGREVGVLVAENPPGAAAFTSRAEGIAAMMGNQVAVAVANALLMEETRRLALTDPLTGLDNRRQLFALGSRALAAARRYGRPLTCIMLDIDHFKRINDTYGHGVGDEVLRTVARRCRASVRDVDVLGRYGGEEFAVVLPEIDRELGAIVAERLRTAIGGSPVATSAGPVQVTVSAGVAELDEDTEDLGALVAAADDALYVAKRSGRDRVEVAPRSGHGPRT